MQRTALESLQDAVKSVRAILLSINVICGFLFLIVFEMMFGWQNIRPAASHAVFVEQLARLAAYDPEVCAAARNSYDSLGTFGQAVVDLAGARVTELLGHSPNSFSWTKPIDSASVLIRDSLWVRLGAKPTWEKEGQLGSFARLIEVCRETLLKRTEADSSFNAGMTGHLVNCLFVIPNNEVSMAIQEISDRNRVNEETRGRRIERRVYYVPLIGISAQLENVNSAVVLFLVFLTFWLRSSICSRYVKSVRTCERSFANMHSMVLLVTSVSYFVHSTQFDVDDKGVPAVPPYRVKLNEGIIPFLLMPYLLAMSSAIAGFYEAYAIDRYIHGSRYLLHGTIEPATWWFNFPIFFLAIVLLLLAKNIYGKMDDVRRDLSRRLDYDAEESLERHRRPNWLLFTVIAAAPFVIFAAYGLIMMLSGEYLHDYFLNWVHFIAYMCVLAVYLFSICFVSRDIMGIMSSRLRRKLLPKKIEERRRDAPGEDASLWELSIKRKIVPLGTPAKCLEDR